MAVRGPKGRQKTKPKSQDSSQNDPPVAVFNLNDLKNINASDEVMSVMNALKMSREVEFFVKALTEIGNVENPAERNSKAATLFEQHKLFMERAADPVIQTVSMQCDYHNIPYEHMYQEIWKLYEEINKLKNEKNADQIQLSSLMQKLDQAYHQSEALLLLANQKINVWLMLLSQPFAQTQPSYNTIISRLFLDLCPMITYLVRQFFYSNLKQNHYYFYYQVLVEKIACFEQYIEKYESVLLEFENQNLPQEEKYPPLEIAFLAIFNANAAASLFLRLFNREERAISLEAKQTRYAEKIDKISRETKATQQDIEYRKRQYKIADFLKEAEKDPIPLCVFLELDDLYQKSWCQHSESEYKGELEVLKEVIKGTRSGLEEAGRTIVFPQMLMVYFKGVFSILSPYKMLSQQQISDEIIIGVIKVVTSLIELLRNEINYKGFYLLSTEGIFKQIAKDLTNDLKKFLAEKKKQEAEEKTLCYVLNRLEIVPSEAPEKTEPLAPPQDSSPVPPSLSIPEEECGTSNNAKEARDKEETPEKDLEEKCKEELSKQEASFDQKSRELQGKRVQDRAELSARLKEEYTAQGQKLEAAYQVEVTKEKAQLEKFRERKERQYHVKDIEILAKHQQKLDSLAAEFAAAKQEIMTSHESKKAEQSNQHQAELAALNAEQAAKLKEIQARNRKEIEKISSSHAVALEQKRKEYLIALESSASEHKNRVAQTKEKNKAEQDAALTSYQVTLEKAKGEQAAALASCQEQGQSQIRTQRAEHRRALAENAATFALQLNEQRALNQSTLDRLVQKHAAELEKATKSLIAAQEADTLLFKQQREKILAVQATKRDLALEKLKRELALKQPWLKSIHAYETVGTIAVPTEIAVLQDLDTLQFEAYIVGGWVRNRLMNLPLNGNEDIDVIVNCDAGDLPENIRNQCWQNPNQPKHLKMGNIDLWCAKWTDLKARLQTKDFSINTFICSFQGHVFDLLGYRNDLFNPFLRILGNTRARFTDDTSLMLRTIRFSNQLNKMISDEDVELIKELSPKMTEMAIGIYINNMQKLFISPLAIRNLAIILRLGILPHIVPTLPMQLPLFDRFWEHKLAYFSTHPQACDGYHVLALFLLIPLLKPNLRQDELMPNVCRCINDFIANYRKEMSEQEKQKIRGWVRDLITGPQGFYEEYLQFQQMMAKAAESLAPRNEAATFTPHYQNGKRDKESPQRNCVQGKPYRKHSAKK